MNRGTITLLLLPAFCIALAQSPAEKEVHETLDAWHKAAAEADYEGYFGRMTADAIFIGTDATENWSFGAFKSFAKPYFDRGRAWSFSALERHIFFNERGDIAWFDELLDTWMGLCRGSGVLQKDGGHWKIAHYVLSIAVPNENVNDLLALKKVNDSVLTQDLRARITGNKKQE